MIHLRLSNEEGLMGGMCGMNGGGGAVYTGLRGSLEERLCKRWRKLEASVEMCCVLDKIKEAGCVEYGN